MTQDEQAKSQQTQENQDERQVLTKALDNLKEIATELYAQKQQRLRIYAIHHLAETCQWFITSQEELLDYEKHPEVLGSLTEAQAKLAQEQAEKEIEYIGRIIQDLK